MINIDVNTKISDLSNFLNNYNILFKDEHLLNVSKAGDGNMNVVLRIKTNLRSLIFKQSRPYVEKYKTIPAPLDRIEVENKFYVTTNRNGFNSNFPKVIYYSKEDFFMIMEDLGSVEDLSNLYHRRKIDEKLIIKLTKILKEIHSCSFQINYPLNNELKKLNHQHIFVLPFIKDNGFSLDSVHKGLEVLAHSFISNEFLKNKSLSIGEQYLKKGSTLLHGDFYPGSWVQNKNKLYVIDPEFSFIGDIEFDLGVFVAHLIIITLEERYLINIINYYSESIDQKLVKYYTGIEIFRRIIGLAQLPTSLRLNEKEYLLKLSNRLLLN
tara:strand:- start:9734 stop:10705 length:972 start_codon:yes stop_codon:yes gene_type:complete